MRTLSLLLIFCFATGAFGFTVILQAGKRVEGTLIGEDRSTIQIKDQSGIVLSFKKSLLDLEAMSVINAGNRPSAGPKPAVKAESQKSLADLARENRKNRPQSQRAYTLSDLEGTPEISLIGSQKIPDLVFQDRASASSQFKEEQSWRKAAIGLRKDLAALREKRISAEASCLHAQERYSVRRVKPHRQAVEILPLLQDPPECKRVSEIDRQIAEAEQRWDDFEDRARKAGVPWRWLE